jgi:ubiquinone biosynthesis protein COQ4
VKLGWPKALLRLRLGFKVVCLGIWPQKTALVFDIADSLYELGAFEETARRIGANPENLRIVREHKLLGKINLQELSQRPAGSLGRAFAEHMLSRGLEPEFYRRRELDEDQAVFVMRMRQTHDLWHVVTGFDTDVPGEMGLQAFSLAYLAVPLSAIIVGGGILRAGFAGGKTLGSVVKTVVEGMQAGDRARGLFAYDWESNWEKPLVDVKLELGLGQRIGASPNRN